MTRRTILIGSIAAVVAVGLALGQCSPPALLNALNSVTPGDGNAAKVGRGIAYGTQPRQLLDVWAPKRSNGKPLPVVIFFYGGAWTMGERGDYGFAGRAFAAQGFVTVVADYRLVPQVRFPVFVQDSALAVKWTRDNIARYGGDPGRITLAGHSAGAYNAAMLALDPHFLRDVGVDPRTIRAAALLAGPYDFYPWDSDRAVAALGAWPDPLATQPISFARADAPPLLLMAGSVDTVVKPGNSMRLAARLRAVGAPHDLKLYPGQSHNDLVMGLSKPFRGRSSALADSVTFLKANSR